MKYRILEVDGKYRVQYKTIFGWFWVMNIADGYMEYNTQEQAEKEINKWKMHGKDNGRVVKEV